MAPVSDPSEPIAIIGASCRFAGGVTSPSKLWDLLCNPRDLSQEVPRDRFNAKGFYHKDGQYHGTTNATKAYWLEEHPRFFDANFFGISPKEAEALDPQQRLLLEGVFEAMEDAGLPVEQYRGEQVGVFAACMTQDYEALSTREEQAASIYHAVGNSRAIIANRISYSFDFQGTSICVDTACSSSLAALQLAVMSLRNGDSVMGCVAGANLMLIPDQFLAEASLGMLSPTGKCHMWDTRADGYARGEGVAVLLVKTLSRAIADGDRIEGIIREICSNADGRGNSTGITDPNPAAQAALIRRTYERAGLDPTSASGRCQYFEAHGTGTQAGDPREAMGIHNAFFSKPSSAHLNEKKLLVGSIKTVVGHTEAASGLAGLLKTIWCMKHGLIPPNLHFENLNPRVQPFYEHLQIPTGMTPWPDPLPGEPRRASINSFGFGGSNVHAIIEAYVPDVHGPGAVTRALAAQSQLNHISGLITNTPFRLPIVFSAASPKSLRDVIQSYKAYLVAHKDSINIHELAWHQYARRSDHPYRVSISATTSSEALSALDSLLTDTGRIALIERDVRSKTTTKSPLRILGIFTGQGAQWPTMSAGLFQQNSVYRNTIRKLDSVLKACPHECSWTLEEQILAVKNESRVQEAAVSQPLCTALQIALVDFLRSIGIDFHTVVGHSSGEIAAAYTAGRLSAEDAIIISYYRGMVAQLAGSIDGQKGSMVATDMSEVEALEFCDQSMFGGRLQVAASNSPTSTTLAGNLNDVYSVVGQLVGQQRFSKRLHVDTAYHSRHMETPAVEYLKLMREYGISPSANGNAVVWVSSVKGRPRIGAGDLDGQYWVDNMVNQVQFDAAIGHALSQLGVDFDCAIEVGPHPALKGPFTQIEMTPDRKTPYASPLKRGQNSGESISEFLGFMWLKFGPSSINMHSYIEQFSPKQSQKLLHSRLESPPLYPFDHTVGYWRSPLTMHKYLFRTEAPHELLGVRSREDICGHDMKWRNILKIDKIPWLSHHRFQDQALLPASAYCIMALDAARYFLAGRPASLVEIQNLEILSGIAIDADGPGVETQFTLQILPSRNGKMDSSTVHATFALYSRLADADATSKVKKDAMGSLRIVLDEPSMNVLPPRQPCLSETLAADTEAFYAMMKAAGLDYSGPFKAVTSIQRRYQYCSATLNRVHPEETTALRISPATLDACFQSAFLSYASPGDGSLWTSFLPTTISQIQFNLASLQKNSASDNSKDILTVDAHLIDCTQPVEGSRATIQVDIDIFNEAGEREIQVEGLVVRALADTNPKDDLELYLHTVMDVDPTDEIVSPSDEDDADGGQGELLAECCDRIASFCHDEYHHGHSQHETISLGEKTPETIATMIHNSNHADYLEFVKILGQQDPGRLLERLPFIKDEAHQVSRFRSHIGRIVRQIVHRYPWMSIIYQATEQTGRTRSVLTSIGDSFRTLTVSGSGQHHEVIKPLMANRIKWQDINFDKGLSAQIGSKILVDLIIVPTTLFRDNNNSITRLKNIAQVMNPGGFLLLIDSHGTILDVRAKGRVLSGQDPSPLTPPKWQDVLESCGFARRPRNSDQSHPVGSIIVRQFRGLATSSSKNNLSTTWSGGDDEFLVIRGSAPSQNYESEELFESLWIKLCLSDRNLKQVELDDVTIDDLEISKVIIVLADLDKPVMTNMTAHRIDQLCALFQPTATVLWVTRGARSGNPAHAASFGFLRTIAAEVPALKLQVLDLGSSNDNVAADTDVIIKAIRRLVSAESSVAGEETNLMQAFEPEIYIENGHRLVARVLPWKQGNDRINAVRRVVTRRVNTLEQCIELVPPQPALNDINDSGHFELREKGKKKQRIVSCDSRDFTKRTLQVDYSTALTILPSGDSSDYLCVGRDLYTDEMCIAVSEDNASYITVPDSNTVPLSQQQAAEGLAVLHQVVRLLMAQAIKCTATASSHDKLPIILIDPDMKVAEFLLDSITPERKVIILGTDYDQEAKSRYDTMKASELGLHVHQCLHLQIVTRDLKHIFARAGDIFNFLPKNHELSQRIATTAPRSCVVHYITTALFSSTPQISDMSDHDMNQSVVAFALLGATLMAMRRHIARPDVAIQTITLNQLIQSQSSAINNPLQFINWKNDRDVLMTINPSIDHDHHHDQQPLFFPNKTYYLFGMTRDFGHSLCRLFLQKGARHIILASRNPTTSPQWIHELRTTYPDSSIRIERADVTDISSLRALKTKMEASTPQEVGGVVNGAMVLEDKLFAQMTAETWERVMQPKVNGSANLDMVFGGDLDFFIMTSSFAAVGGHAGQSNYAAANMYMCGLAAERRLRRGVPGFALNIGVIYGLGFLHRERGDLYTGLEREGYPPISEHQLHHMFLEAIVAGRPASASSDYPPASSSLSLGQQQDHPFDLTTGLRRYRRDSPNPLHWHLDPRFGHFAKHNHDDDAVGSGEIAATTRKSLQEQLAALGQGQDREQQEAATEIISAGLIRRLQNVLGLPEGSIDGQRSLADLGLDSMNAAEVRGWFSKNLGIHLSLLKILDSPSIHKLCMDVTEQFLATRTNLTEAAAQKN